MDWTNPPPPTGGETFSRFDCYKAFDNLVQELGQSKILMYCIINIAVWLQVLKDEIGRLKRIKDELEKVKEKGDKDLPAWIGEDTLFIKLLQNKV